MKQSSSIAATAIWGKSRHKEIVTRNDTDGLTGTDLRSYVLEEGAVEVKGTTMPTHIKRTPGNGDLLACNATATLHLRSPIRSPMNLTQRSAGGRATQC